MDIPKKEYKKTTKLEGLNNYLAARSKAFLTTENSKLDSGTDELDLECKLTNRHL